jgi:hypothetical protein
VANKVSDEDDSDVKEVEFNWTREP